MTEEKRQEKIRRAARRRAETWARKSQDPVRLAIVERFGSQRAAAAFLDISECLLIFYLNGDREPPSDILSALLKETGITREIWSAGADGERLAQSA